MSTKELLLTFANIKQGEKYYVSTRSSSKVDSFSFLYRRLYGETREATADFIKTSILEFDVRNEEDIEVLESTLPGICNLMETYKGDPVADSLANIRDMILFKLEKAKEKEVENSLIETIKAEEEAMLAYVKLTPELKQKSLDRLASITGGYDFLTLRPL